MTDGEIAKLVDPLEAEIHERLEIAFRFARAGKWVRAGIETREVIHHASRMLWQFALAAGREDKRGTVKRDY